MKSLLIITGLSVIILLFCSLISIVWAGLSDEIGNADVALVLGNKVNEDGTPSARLRARLETAITHFKSGNYPLIIVSGATGREGVPEGTAMARFLVKNGIPENAIIIDNDGFDTHASAKNTTTILHKMNLKSVFAITQFFHIPRSILALKKEGVTVVYHAHPIFFEARDIYSTVREVPAYMKYLFSYSGGTSRGQK